ncbi:YqiA/YcfP family alpha/beta fold hydrolase [Psychromonas sp. MME2]|uniref:YqiA/YcfP family alpha/beta fold hydrolase n=1 Tax=unclassified Psychromonas TaxID=2614957 RepID=UPI00339BD90A
MRQILLALHGFHSSPASLKAQQMSEYVALYHPEITFICPQLPCFPEQMWASITSIFAQNEGAEIAVMGSSLGGFLATKIAQQYQVKVLLINPAVHPDRLLSHAGVQKHPYTLDEYVIDEHYLQQLLTLKVDFKGSPEQCWVLLQEADDVLDYRQALQQYKHCKITCEEGGDHSFIGFERYLQDIIKFLF